MGLRSTEALEIEPKVSSSPTLCESGKRGPRGVRLATHPIPTRRDSEDMEDSKPQVYGVDRRLDVTPKASPRQREARLVWLYSLVGFSETAHRPDGHMALQGTIYKVFIAAPSDVAPEKDVIREAVARWNDTHGERMRVVFFSQMWETHATPELRDTAQAVLNDQLVDRCDLLVATFWTRLGTPTKSAASGTAEEIERVRVAGKPVMVYFKRASVDPETHDPVEYGRVQQYKLDLQQRGLLAEYHSKEELSERLQRDLAHQAEKLIGARVGEPAAVTPETGNDSAITPADAKEPATLSPPNAPDETPPYRLLEQGKYEDGMTALRKRIERPDDAHSVLASESFGRMLAATDGHVHQAFIDLERSAHENPEHADTWFWYARALSGLGRYDDALVAMTRSRDASTDRNNATYAIRSMAFIHASAGEPQEGTRLLREALAVEQAPEHKARLIGTLAELYEVAEEIKDIDTAILLKELALDVYPLDSQLRHNIAKAYAEELKSAALAFHHYRQAASRDEKDAAAITNAGWYASELELRINSRVYYRRAEKLDEPYAIANLAWALLDVGFATEAREILTGATKRGVSHLQIDKALGGIAKAEEDEGKRLTRINKNVDETLEHRLRHARALLKLIATPQALSGVYQGTTETLTLEVDGTGGVSGLITLDKAHIYRVTGRLRGEALEIQGVTIPPERQKAEAQPTGALPAVGVLPLLLEGEPLRGFGVLVRSANRLIGYWAKGRRPVDPTDIDELRKLRLTKLEETKEGA
jgi:tetratricopeptide (TPR) repeat protein